MFPSNKKFAFTIIDDTDNSTLTNTKPIYDLLNRLGFKTTKTVWVYDAFDKYHLTQTLQDPSYQIFINGIRKQGFEIALHSVGSGSFFRNEIIEGLDKYNEFIGEYPKVYINHSKNPDNIYWNINDRLAWPISMIISFFNLLRNSRYKYFGHVEGSKHFWGDISKSKIKYLRNLTFNDINTLKQDPKMPYRDISKSKYSNYWFSSSDGHTIDEFLELISNENVDKLEREEGCCIVYTHFAEGFVENGVVNPEFQKRLEYLSKKGGWYAPASEILDYLNEDNVANYYYKLKLSFKWIFNRIIKFLKYNK